MANIVTVNGINTDGNANIDLLGDELRRRGHNVVDLNTPRIGWFRAAFRKVQKTNGRLLMEAAVEHFGRDAEVHVIGHSNGAATIYRSMWPKDRFEWATVVLFNAAMRDSWAWPSEGFNRLENVYNVHDKALKWGSRLSWIMPAHIFGNMGRTGYAGTPPDDRITNHANPFKHSPNRHNPFERDEDVNTWADAVEEWVG